MNVESGKADQESRRLYGGRSPVELPAYTIREAARILGLSPATVRSWALGRHYPLEVGTGQFAPVIEPADPEQHHLSFLNLVEIHVLASLRRRHQVKLDAVRSAIEYLKTTLRTSHPLAAPDLLTANRSLFVERYGQLINASHEGQLAMREMLSLHLRRIERDPSGLPIRLFPFTRSGAEESSRTVAIDPRVQFGRPGMAGTGIPTAIIAERYKAGDTIEDLATDYGRRESEIEEALRFELPARAA